MNTQSDQAQPTHDEAKWLDDYIANVLLDARNGDINVERDAYEAAIHIRDGIRDDIVNGKGNWLAARRDTPLAESNSSASPAFVLSVDTLMSFSVDDDALQSWLRPIHPEELELSLPSTASECPSRDLSCLVCDAIDNGALIGDPRLRLAVYEGDDDESNGYYAVLRNATGDQRFVGITSGWTELVFADPTASLVDQAREYLTVVCAVANTLIAIASPSAHHHPTADAAEGTTQR
ncbi:hypothetical protein PJK45_28065 [Mycobacterium kansasii]